ESTGIRSVQVQINRLNAVLGPCHWRKLLHYEGGGIECLAHVVVGNKLAECQLDEHGELLACDADVIAHVQGWGGHERATTRGDMRKGAETNALKRCIAQLGPGQDVYCLDIDEDHNTTGEAAPAPAQIERPAEPDAEAELKALLVADDD